MGPGATNLEKWVGRAQFAMPKRIDIDGGDAQNEIADALRQLDRRQRAVDRDSELERAVQEVAEQQKVSAPPPPQRTPDTARGSRLAWIGLAVVVIGLVAAVLIFMRQEPPPAPAQNAQEAVRGFWTCLIEGKYEAATYYGRYLQTTYGSPSQAGEALRERFQGNPPAVIRTIGDPELVPDTTTYRVPYEVYMKSGLPRVGEFIVSDTGSPSTGFIIINGGV